MKTDLTKQGRQPKTEAKRKAGADPEKRVPYLLLVLCVVLAGWSFWTAGIFDDEIADDLRTSSVYADPGYDLDEAAAERAIGNRRLAAVFLDSDQSSDARDVCHAVERAADGVLVVIFYRDGDGLRDYGCSWLYGDDDKAIGKNYVAESLISDGTSGFADRPLLIAKQMATNYDQLVRADTVPGQAREIHSSAPRYLLAFVAIGAVVLGAGALYLLGRRAGRQIADTNAAEADELDDDVRLQARLAGIAAAILRLDARHKGAQQAWLNEYRSVCVEYTDLTAAAARPDQDSESASLFDRTEVLMRRVNELESFGAAPASSK